MWYTNQQLKLLITARENGSVVGVARIFDLSSCYVTNVIIWKSSNWSIMLGPILFSWDVQGETYHGFLSALQNKLQGAPQSSIILVLTKKLGKWML